MLGTAETDSLCAKLTRFLCVRRCIRVGADFKSAVFVSPRHNPSELSGDGCIHGRDNSVVDIAGGAVDGDRITLVVFFACQRELLVLLIHCDVTASGYTAGTHTARHNGCMACHTAADCQDTLGCLHTGDILRRGLKTYQHDFLAFFVPLNRILRRENDLSAGSTRRSAKALSNRSRSL